MNFTSWFNFLLKEIEEMKHRFKKLTGLMFIMPKDAQIWKLLVIGNIILTVFLFWILYSQVSYLTKLVENALPYAIPEQVSRTAIVINPVTGFFVLINFPVILVVLIGIAIIFALIYLFKSLKIL
jgi:hypothetical protein